ncbi:hypothetical protein GF359_03865 [candidate division WOR-3 bacterium]|uniref:Uncharacterized protein n=1 Tax=candidate division WOR-3 bacterium TaxID=2052148 RepID=A0A9D5QC60_UNCW3|nr:hypothetical protein [candidate division WOR-3 bacterium]MBD3364333.1 hypothetical protein [candidate division WOR-3 bacterium]
MPIHIIGPIKMTLAILGLLMSIAWVVIWVVVLFKRWNKPLLSSIVLG